MTPLLKIILAYLACMTILGFVLMAADKRRAKKGGRRVPEAALMALALLGASFGEILGMNICGHKTRHPKFFIGLPVILLAQLVLAYLLLRYL